MSTPTAIPERYEVREPIGNGGMALVYRARDTKLGRDVAVKLLADNLASDDEFHRRFLREARIAGGLSHPHIIPVYDVGEIDGRPFIVMEDAAGGSLYDRLRRDGPLPLGEAAELGRQCAEALAYAHEQGVIHRDVKPHNLLLSRSGCLKVADFGIARPIDDTRLTQAGSVLGTARYLAPEQARGEPGSPASDVYSLGVCLWEMIAGGPPSGARLPAVPPGLEHLLKACLSSDPRARPSAAEVATTLAAPLADGEPTRLLRRPPPHRPRPRMSRHTGVALVALAVLGIGAAVADAGRDSGPGSAAGKEKPRARAIRAPSGPTAEQHAHNLAAWIDHNAR